ncbi:hypothetical protein PNOK_0624100 [Pyrrhoderma noxium]|uniref:Uncharacterized protein n=1 Tax=Pyrrhoderma noxium TaxID=2282107 RepID=A0A286UE42_9AGAM|nr:hypothetical protein PNOK_0624100 [Pyrrhoderma noxium]
MFISKLKIIPPDLDPAEWLKLRIQYEALQDQNFVYDFRSAISLRPMRTQRRTGCLETMFPISTEPC